MGNITLQASNHVFLLNGLICLTVLMDWYKSFVYFYPMRTVLISSYFKKSLTHYKTC